MRLSGPTLRDELRGPRLRSLRVYIGPLILALALYAFYAVGNYRERETPYKPVPHGNIYGTVIDGKKNPVRGASVTISFSSSKEPVPIVAPTTDAEGHFYMADLPAAQYILQATADGFDMQTQSTLVDPGRTKQIKIPLYLTSDHTRPPPPSLSP